MHIVRRYLLITSETDTILKPESDLILDCYVAGLWSREDHNDEVKSRNEYVLCFSSCLVLWITHLQNGLALSFMESEYVALSWR